MRRKCSHSKLSRSRRGVRRRLQGCELASHLPRKLKSFRLHFPQDVCLIFCCYALLITQHCSCYLYDGSLGGHLYPSFPQKSEIVCGWRPMLLCSLSFQFPCCRHPLAKRHFRASARCPTLVSVRPQIRKITGSDEEG